MLARKGYTQGDPLSIFLYGMRVFPLIRKLKELHIDCVQPWYADNAAVLEAFQQLNFLYEDILRLGPGYGYIPNPSKWKVVVHLQHVVVVVDFFNTHGGRGFKICTGSRYLGGYIGKDIGCNEYVPKKVLGCTSTVNELAIIGSLSKVSSHCLYMSYQERAPLDLYPAGNP